MQLVIILAIILLSDISLSCDDFSGRYLSNKGGSFKNVIMEFTQKSCTDIELKFYKDEKIIEADKIVSSFSEEDKKIIARECLGDKESPPSPVCSLQTFRIRSWSKDGKTIYWAITGISDGLNPLFVTHNQVHYRFTDASHNVIEQGGYILEAGEEFLEQPRVTARPVILWNKN